MGDIFTEQLVKRKKTGKTMVGKIALILITIAFFVIGMMKPLVGFLFVIMIGVDIYLFRSMDIEYEYLYINGNLDIDKIMSKSRRKKVFEINVSELELLAPAGCPELRPFQGVKAVDFTSGEEGSNIYEMIVLKNGEKKKIMFEPNATIIDGMRMYAPRKVVR